MNFFKRDKVVQPPVVLKKITPVYDESAALTGKAVIPEEKPVAAAKPASPPTTRESVEAIASEMKSSGEQQIQASRRILALNKTISKMEVGLRHVERIEVDNTKLNNELISLRKKLDQKTDWATDQETKLLTLERQHNDVRQQLENSQADIAQRKDRETADHERITKQGREIEALTSLGTQKDERLAGLLLSNQKLQDEVAQQGATLSSQTHRIMELQKNLEEVTARFDSKNQLADNSAAELKNMRVDFNEMKAKYFESSGGLENAKYDLKTQKNVYEETLKRRDDETLALKSRIEQLNTQLRIKDNMSTHFDEEIVTLRTQLETERERNNRNEKRFRSKTDEVERNSRSLARNKVEYENLNAKFVAAMEDIDTLRKINLVQKQKLERYAAIGGVGAVQSLVAAAEDEAKSATEAKLEPSKADPAEANTDEEAPFLKAVK